MKVSVLDQFDSGLNFWKVNPWFVETEPFKTLYSEDKSKGKEKSSRVMWGVAQLCDPVKSQYRNLNEEDRKKLIAEDWFGDIDFDWSTLIVLTEGFIKLSLSKIERSILEWGRKLDERDAFIKATPYNMDNADSLDKLLANSPKIYEMYKKMHDDYLNETVSEGRTKGGKPESAGEKGIV